MDPELDAKIVKLINAGATDEEIDLFIKEEQAKAAPVKQGTFLGGLAKGVKEGVQDVANTFVEFNPYGRIAANIKGKRVADPLFDVSKRVKAQGAAEKVGNFAGRVVGELPVNLMLGGPLANVGKTAITKALGSAVTKKGAFAKGMLAGLPGQVVAGVATTAAVNPDRVMTKQGLAETAAFSTLGSLFDGAFAIKAFNKRGVQSFIEEVASIPTAPPGTAEGVKSKIDDFLGHFERLASGDPVAAPPKKIIGIEQLRTPSKIPLEIPLTNDVRPWEPKRKVVPNSVDVQGYAEEISADLTQRDKISKSIVRVMNHVKRGDHSEEVLAQIPKLQSDFDKLTLKISDDLGKIGKSAEEVRGLVQGGVKGGPRSVINIREQLQPNMKNPIPSAGIVVPKDLSNAPRGSEQFKNSRVMTPPSILRPGSGNQSPYAYIPPEQSFDPLAPALTPKKSTAPPPDLNDAEKHFYNRIDIGNENAAAVQKEARYLLDTPIKRLDYKVLDFLRPIKEASSKAYDYASKMLRVNMRAQSAIDDAIYIPVGDGTYTRGADGLVPLAARLGGDSGQMMRFNLFVHAKQALSGVKTPFNTQEAQRLVTQYTTDYPDIVKAYEEGHKPLVRSMLDAIKAYGLTTEQGYETMLQFSDYVNMSRSAYGDNFASSGFLKGRKNPESQKLIGDYWVSMMSNIRGLVRAGERTNVIRELAKARLADPKLAGAIDIIAYQKPEGFDELVKSLPEDAPEALKQALADAFSVPAKGNLFPLLLDGKRVTIRVNDEIKSGLDFMQSRAPKTYNPENLGLVEKILTNPANTLAKLEKTATSIYSVYRDMFGFGIPLDAIEAAINASARGYKFNLLKSPVQGFFSLYNDDPLLKDLAGHAGLLGMRYANPNAEGIVRNTDDLIRLAKHKGLMLRIMKPGAALSELAGNLSNASRAGVVLANRDRPMDELATLHNEIIGDPAKGGALLAAYARFTGFMNFPMQATRAQTDALAKAPQNLAFFLARAGGQLVAPTIAAYALTRYDSRIKELSKDPNGRNYIYLPNPFNADEPIAIPKPQGIAGALFVTLPQMLMEELEDSGNTEMLEQVSKAAIQSIMPNPMPLTLNMMLGVATGKTLDFRGAVDGRLTQDIVPKARQGLLPEDAGAAGASQTSQLLAQLTDIDAGKWERVMRTFMIGTSYNMYRGVEDMTLGEKDFKPMNPLTVVPGIRNVDASTAGTRYVSELYTKSGEVASALKSFDAAVRNGQPEKAVGIFKTHDAAIREAMKLKAQLDVLAGLDQQINLMKYNEFHTNEEKQVKVRELQAERIRLAKKFLGVKEKE